MSMMKGFSNAFRIPELRKKILVTLGLVFVCRLIAQIPTPGVDWHELGAVISAIRDQQAASGSATLLGWFDLFTGGALGQCSIGFLSIWPYISAQIVIQLLSSIIPSLQKMKKEGENGRQQLAQITRYLTIVLCVVQAWALASTLSNPQLLGETFAGHTIVPNPGYGFHLMTVIGMTTASLFIMWLADQITTFGIGNGASLIIMINITSRLPAALQAAYSKYFVIEKNPTGLILLVVFFLLIVMGTVMLTQGVRKIAIHSTRRSLVGGATYGMQQTFMPLRVNFTGVMPIIFAQPLIQIVSAILKWISGGQGKLNDFALMLSGEGETVFFYLVIYGSLIVFFTFFWVATQFNAIEISENFKKDGSYVPGIRPGIATAEYLDDVMTKITLIGALGLLALAILPLLIYRQIGVPWSIASFFGGTSLLIIVGVALDTLRIMESHLLVRKYEGFLSHGSLRGRGGV